MSLILDALRKADSERERGAVPGLHAQSIALPSLERQEQSLPWAWIVLGLVGVLTVVAGAYLVVRSTTTSQSGAAKADAAQPRAAARSPALVSESSAARPAEGSTPSPSVQPSAATSPVPTAALPPIAAEPQTVAKPAPWVQAPEREPAKPVERTAEPAAARQEAKPEARQPPPEPPLPTRDQLPQGLRAQLPPMTLGGSIYSPNPSSRSVIVNGQIYRENDALTPDLVLEQIRPNAAVFRFKGQRFELTY